MIDGDRNFDENTPIETDEQYQEILAEIERLMDSDPQGGTEGERQLLALVERVVRYEDSMRGIWLKESVS